MATSVVRPQVRLASLDVFRGLAVAGMVLVNNPGSWDHLYPALDHASWHGCTPTDLVFPFFLFIVGVAMAYSFERYAHQYLLTGPVFLRVLRRGMVLFGLGLLLNGFPVYDLGSLRLLGVLQRIALAYVLASFVVLTCSRGWQWLIALLLLVGYWAALSLVPVPGYGPGVLSAEGNLGAFVDRAVIGTAHLYGQSTFDPEGLLSTLPAVVTVLFGYFAGGWLKTRSIHSRTSLLLAASGLGGIGLGWLWGLAFPINKQLWTSSYVVFTAGWALVVLAACFEIVEVRKWRVLGWPFEVFGLNAIVLFVGSGLVGRLLKRTHVGAGANAPTVVTWIYEHWFVSWAGPLNGSLGYALVTLLVWWLVLYGLYRRKWFLKI